MALNVPPGGVAWPGLSKPQQARGPLGLIAQTGQPPALMLPTTMSAVAVGIVIPWLPGGGTVARAGADVRARQIRLSAMTATRTSRADRAPPIDAEFSLSTGHARFVLRAPPRRP